MSLSILGIGTAIPEFNADQREAAYIAKQFVYDNDPNNDGWFDKVYEYSMVEYRGSVLLEAPDENGPNQSFYPPAASTDDRGPTTAVRMQQYMQQAAPLAVQAARIALQRAGVDAPEITHLITVTCTGFSAPGIDFNLINELGLYRGIQRVQVGFMGCHGAVNALIVARAIAESDPAARVLIASVELCSLHYFYGWDPSKLVANALFSDGAAALVGRRRVATDDGAWSVRTTGSLLMPDSDDAMTWTIGNHGFEMTLEPSVPELIQDNLRGWVESWLAENDLTIQQIGSWAIHPGGPKIIGSVAVALGLTRDATAASRHVLSQYGNMSSATILFVIQQLQECNAPRPCVALAFGPGLVVEAAIFD